MPANDTCRLLLDPKFRGVCLGVDLNMYIFKELYEWAPTFWRNNILARLSALERNMLAFSRKVLEDCIKLVEARKGSSSSTERLQQFSVLQVCVP